MRERAERQPGFKSLHSNLTRSLRYGYRITNDRSRVRVPPSLLSKDVAQMGEQYSVLVFISLFWGCGAAGSAIVLQARGRGVVAHQLHFIFKIISNGDVAEWLIALSCRVSPCNEVRSFKSSHHHFIGV